MKLFVAVLIAAVTVNCLVMAINGGATNDALAVPYIDMLLPPYEDVKDNSKEATPVTASTATTTATTIKPITNEVNNNIPKPSIEPLLPPLFEANFEQEETKKSTTEKTSTTTTTKKPTTTTKPITTTTTTTIKPTTATLKPTLKPSKISVPELILDPFLPPLYINEIVDDVEEDKLTAKTTQKPKVSYKTTTKSRYQQQTQHINNNHQGDKEIVNAKNYQNQQPQLKNLPANNNKGTKNYNKVTGAAASNFIRDKYVTESKTPEKQVNLATTYEQKENLQSRIETKTQQHVAKQVVQHKQAVGNLQYADKQLNNNFGWYLGSTTARPPKYGLPTITPFPHRLGR